MLKNIFKKIIFGIAMGSTILNLMLLFVKLAGFDDFFAIVTSDYIRQSLCCMLVATAFTILSIAYESERLGFGLQVLIHMGGGLIIYFIVAYYAKWLSPNMGLGILLSSIFLMVIIAFIIWYGFYLYYKHEAKKINSQISKLN